MSGLCGITFKFSRYNLKGLLFIFSTLSVCEDCVDDEMCAELLALDKEGDMIFYFRFTAYQQKQKMISDILPEFRVSYVRS